MKKKIALATGNKHKLKEVKEIFGDEIEILSMSEAGCTIEDIEENGKSFEENSYIKSSAVSENTGIPSMADDSGIVCDGVSDIENGILYPGIISARFFETLKEMFVNESDEARSSHPFLYERVKELLSDAKKVIEETDEKYTSKDEKNFRILLEIMKDVTKRDCRFVCAATYVDIRSGERICSVGTCEGKLLYEPDTTGNGFGYDPIFFSLDCQKPVSSLTDDEKNAISHRGNAMRELRKKLF